MSLSTHLSIHLLTSLLAGFIVWRIWKKPIVSFAAAFAGGVLVDLDHFIDYFLAFGFKFNLNYFIHGYQFLKSDKIYIFFHAWEYVIILLSITFVVKNKIARTIVLSLALGLFFHLCVDVDIDNVRIQTYSIINREINNFEIQELAYPEHWVRHLQEKAVTKLED